MASDPFRPSLARRGFDALLGRHPHLDVLKVEWGEEDSDVSRITDPWLLVTLGQPSDGAVEAFARWEFAIWKRTGSVYTVNRHGAVNDDPIIEVE
jgi:hypothetical protein